VKLQRVYQEVTIETAWTNKPTSVFTAHLSNTLLFVVGEMAIFRQQSISGPSMPQVSLTCRVPST